MTDNPLRIGRTVNLLLGLKSGWNASEPSSSPFFDGPAGGLIESSADVSGAGTWGDVRITLHDNAESVLSAAYDFPIVDDTSHGSPGPRGSFGSGPLIVRNANRDAALAALKETFGIDFAAPGRGYALIEVRREAGTVTHATFARGVFKPLTAEAFQGLAVRRTMLRLPVPELKPFLERALNDSAEAKAYLDFFAQHGTHYVSSITNGDRILQILAYEPDQWKVLRSDFADAPQELQGPLAYQAFAYYVRPLSKGGDGTVYGMVAERGHVTIASRDPAFAASVAAGEWQDTQWAKGNCVLAPWLNGTVNLGRFAKVVPIRVGLSPLTLMMTAERQIAAWSVFRAAMAAIYAPYVNPAFPSARDPDFGGIYPVNRDGLLSALATPTINAYVQRFDLGSLQLAVPEIIKQFGLVANLLESADASALALPGGQVALLAQVINVIAPADGSVPTLTLDDEAYAGFSLTCDRFFGGLYVVDRSGTRRKLIADGIVFERGPAGPEGRYTAVATGDVHAAPTIAQLQAFSTQLTASLNALESQLAAWQAMAPQQKLRFLTRFAEWIVRLIPKDCPDQKLLGLRLDALYLARAANALARGVRQVPYLTYKAYAPAVEAINAVAVRIQDTIVDYQDQIRQRKIAETLITDLGVINQNVIDTGKLLTGYFQACAQHQQDLAESYGDIAASDRQGLDQAEQTITTLQAEMGDQRAAVDSAIDAYKAAIEDKIVADIVNLSLEIAKSIFELGFEFEMPGGEGKTEEDDLKTIVNDIQKVVAMIDAINKLKDAIEGGKAEIAAADAALTDLGTGPSPTAATLQWQEFQVRMKNALEKGPAMSERDDLEAAVQILILRGEALVRAQAQAASLITQMYQAQRRQTVAADQSDRLKDLTTRLNPANVQDLDLADIDLVGLTGELDQLQSQMMVQLVRAVVTQDLALQYEYLQQPATPPSSFDLISVGVYMVSEQGNLINAKTALNPPPTTIDAPVTYVVAAIPASQLAGGGTFRFQIPTDAKEFADYTMVRFSRVDLTVDAIGATTGGQFTVRLQYQGDPFYDRDQQRKTLEFSTNPRIINYLGTVVPGQPASASAGSDPSGDYSSVTPFSKWEISFPADATNAGLIFSGASVKLTLAFHLTAQINPPADRLALAQGRGRDAVEAPTPHGTGQNALALARAMDAAPTSPGIQGMLALMQGKSCLMGWDAVFSYTEDKVNAFLLQEYEKLKKSDQGHLVIPLRTDTTTPNPITGNATYTTWAMTLGAPRVAFQTGNDTYATVYLDIISGQYEYGILEKNGQKIVVDPQTPTPPGSYIQGQVELAQAKGTIDGQHDVVINLPAGSWNASNLTISVDNPSFNGFLTTQLTTQSTVYRIGTLDTTGNPQLPALTPKSFQFKTVQTKSGANLLQLYIVTDGSAPDQLALNDVPEPVPSGVDCSLLISSRILFQQILPASFSQAKSMLGIVGVDPKDPDKAWSSLGNSGTVQVPVSVDYPNRVNSPISVSMQGMTITAGPPPAFNLNLAQNHPFNVPFQAYVCSEGHYRGGCLGGEWDDYSVGVTSSLTGTLPIAVTGSGEQQDIQINEAGVDVQVDGDVSGKGADFQNAVLGAFRDASRKTIPPAVSVQFPAISFFALKNLLFPGDNMVDMSLAYAPGDLVIFGTFAPSGNAGRR